MALAKAEWWNRAAAPPRPEVSILDRLKQTAKLMAANVGRVVLNLIDPPYPTPDGKPLRFYKPGESTFTQEQIEQLSTIAKMFEGGPSLVAGPGLRSPVK